MNNNRYNVLLVTDDLFEIDLARCAATESRLEINLAAVAGGEAVLDWVGDRVANKEPLPHIILLDLKLPKLDGLAALRRLRGDEATRDIPILVFSAEYTHEEVLLSYRAGANTFVSKPADVAQFSEFFCERLAYWMHPLQREMFFAG